MADSFIHYLKLFTYATFLLFGIVGFLKSKKISPSKETSKTDSKSSIIKFLSSLTQNSIFIVASSIAIGELGDKTFLSSIGLGIQYPLFKVPLICGSVFRNGCK